MKKKIEERVFQFRPGWMIVDCSSASGGIQYLRELVKEKSINSDNGMQTDHKTRKTVDHVEYCAAIDATVKRVDYVLRKHCARTEMGWFADDNALRRVKTEIAEIQAEADDLNVKAERAKSQRRAKIRITPLKLDLAQPEAVQEIAHTIQSVLVELRDALRSGDIPSLHKLRIRAKNLDRLATGFQSDAIRFALERVPIAANEIREAGRVAAHGARAANARLTDEDLGKIKVKAGKKAAAKIDLEVIEAAIEHFEASPLTSHGDHAYDPLAQIAS